MKILHVLPTRLPIPPTEYGGTERVVWALMQFQQENGHQVRLLVNKNVNHRLDTQEYNPKQPISAQVDGWADIVHFHYPFKGDIATPHLCTEHGNHDDPNYTYPLNTIFLSKQHAQNYNAQTYVHNGLYWADYGDPNLRTPPSATPYIHFLAKASWRVKNLSGAIKIAKKTPYPLHILGGHRLSLKRHKYLHLSPRLKFHGMVGGARKNELIKQSSALLFPVLWHEPFGLAVIESLYLGCPVFASPYGSLPELINDDTLGLLSTSSQQLSQALHHLHHYDRRACHHHAKTHFNHQIMGARYQQNYQRILDGETLNPHPPKRQPNLPTQLPLYD